MDIIGELSKIINRKVNNNVTFYLKNIPILTVNFEKNSNAVIITNNMKELRNYELKLEGEVDYFVSYVTNILVYSGVDELIETSKDSKIKFYSDPYLYGEIEENKVIVEKEEVADEETTIHKKYEIATTIKLSGLTIADIVGAFALQFYD